MFTWYNDWLFLLELGIETNFIFQLISLQFDSELDSVSFIWTYHWLHLTKTAWEQ